MIAAKFGAETGQGDVETAQAVVARTQVQLARTIPLDPGAIGVVEAELIAFLLHPGIGVLREAGTGRGEQAAMRGRGSQHAFHQLEAEGQRRADQLRVVVGGIGRS